MQAGANLASVSRKLDRSRQGSFLDTSKWAHLKAVVLAREAEVLLCQHQEIQDVQADDPEHHVTAGFPRALSLFSAALQVCLDARSFACPSKRFSLAASLFLDFALSLAASCSRAGSARFVQVLT